MTEPAQQREDWLQFNVLVGSLDPDRLEQLMYCHGAQAVTLTDAGDDPVLEPKPGETPLWSSLRMTGLFAGDALLDPLKEDIVETFDLTSQPVWKVEELAGREWEREWLSDYHPMKFGERLWVCPGEQETEEEDAVIVRLDPGLAFGTGTHATTGLCMEWLDSVNLNGKSILDYGCGSGILTIAALLLGARSATALDIDPQAIVATRQNAERNAVANRVTAIDNAAELDAVFDVVVANILARPLIDNAAGICTHLLPGGDLALSGILAGQVDEVIEAYRQWIRFEPVTIREEWALLKGRKS